MVGVELLEGYKRAVCDTCRYIIFWLKIVEHISLNFSSLVSDSGLLYNNCYKGFLVWPDSKERCMHCN